MSTARSPRQPRDETRRVLLEVGARLLFQRGLKGGAEHITLAEVFQVVEEETGRRITGASVYRRIWENQNEYQRDLLLEAASRYPAGEEEPVRTVAQDVLRDADLSSLTGRAAAMREICRVAGQRHVEVLEASRFWQIWLAIWSITVSTPALDDDLILGPALEQGHDRATQAFVEVFDDVRRRLGYEMRDPFSVQQFAVAVCALAEGITLKHRFSPDGVRSSERPTAPDGAMQTWSLFGVGMEGLVSVFLAPLGEAER
jgi:hypothetical protein